MVNERALLAAMKDAWKGKGYIVAHRNGSYLIGGDGWTLLCAEKLLPRKALALLVEHIGAIPEGECLNVSKKAGIQTAIAAVQEESFRQTEQRKQEDAAPTRLTFDGYRVWQGESLRVLLMAEDLTGILVLPAGGTSRSFEDGILLDAGAERMIVLKRETPPEAEYLEVVQWE